MDQRHLEREVQPPSYQRSTRSTLRVFQRLGLPGPSSISKCTLPGCRLCNGQLPSLRCLERMTSIAVLLTTPVGVDPGFPEIVETAEDVVVPPWWKRHPQPTVVDQFAGRKSVHEAPFQVVLVGPGPCLLSPPTAASNSSSPSRTNIVVLNDDREEDT